MTDELTKAEEFLNEQCFEFEPIWVMRWKVGENDPKYLTNAELIAFAKEKGMPEVKG
jgi:hypothetical protein